MAMKPTQRVLDFQRAYNRFLTICKVPVQPVATDGQWGPQSAEAANCARYALGYAVPYDREKVTPDRLMSITRRLRHPVTAQAPAQWKRGLSRRRGLRKTAARPLRARALAAAEALVGVMEHGGNNRGPDVERIVRSVGGSVGAPWCGYFVAACYQLAGRQIRDVGAWGYVPWMTRIPGARVTSDPQPGDIVRFSFGHTGLFVRRVDGGSIETIEGNTGTSGAVSDSSTGGDGVYRKRRSTGLVQDYVTLKD